MSFMIKGLWNGKTPAEALDLTYDKTFNMCKKGETAIIHSVQFFHSTISWTLANADQEGGMMNYGVTVRAESNEWIAADNFFMYRTGLHSFWNGAAETYAANRRSLYNFRESQRPQWHYQKGVDVGRKLRVLLAFGGYNGDVLAFTKDVTVFCVVEYEIKKREIPKFVKRTQ